MKFGVGADDDRFVKVKVQSVSITETDVVLELHNAHRWQQDFHHEVNSVWQHKWIGLELQCIHK